MRYSYLENCHGDVLRVVKKEANKIELSPTLAKRRFEEVLYCLASVDWKVCPRIIAGIELMLQNHVYVREGNDFPSYPLKVDDRITEVDIPSGIESSLREVHFYIFNEWIMHCFSLSVFFLVWPRL